MSKRPVWTRLLKIETGASVPQALLDHFIDKWDVWLAAIISGGGMSYLSIITSWLNAWGPIAWAAGFWIGVFLFLAMRWLWTVTRLRKVLIEYTVKKTDAYGVKTLAPVHQSEVIDLWRFYNPFFRPTENVRFENCDLMGPLNLVADGCQFLHSVFIDCEIVIVRPDRPVKGATQFRFCTLLRCQIYRVTLLMNKQTYDTLPPEMRQSVTVTSDGRVGDI